MVFISARFGSRCLLRSRCARSWRESTSCGPHGLQSSCYSNSQCEHHQLCWYTFTINDWNHHEVRADMDPMDNLSIWTLLLTNILSFLSLWEILCGSVQSSHFVNLLIPDTFTLPSPLSNVVMASLLFPSCSHFITKFVTWDDFPSILRTLSS